MKCAICTAEGKRSEVKCQETRVLIVQVEGKYDAKGLLHIHDPNPVRIEHGCSRGHRWLTVKFSQCSTCGWKLRSDQTRQLPAYLTRVV